MSFIIFFFPLQFVFQIGLDVTASISYHITPEASTSVCDKYPKGDANACFEVHSTTTGKVSLSAFWKRGWSECRWRGWSLSCKVLLIFCLALRLDSMQM